MNMLLLGIIKQQQISIHLKILDTEWLDDEFQFSDDENILP